MAEWIMKEETDMDGVVCYIKTGKLVRCKDCKHWKKAKLFPDDMVCTYAIYHSFVRHEDDFCSKGERKDGDGK